MLACQFMASVVINGRKPQSLVMHVIKRTGTLFQKIKKYRHTFASVTCA